MTILYSVILAGGAGKRLWPLSREMFPKQMLKFDGEYTLFQRTFLNIATIIDDKNIITTTNVKYISAIKEQLNALKEKFSRKTDYKVLSEPIFKNTAPALSMAVKYISDKSKLMQNDTVVIALPSDQIIADRVEYASLIEKGIKLAQEGYIVAFGSDTDKTDENFGYIKTRKYSKLSEIEDSALKVSEFIEKPSKQEFKDNLKGKIFVNSGIYMFTPQTYMNELKKCVPELYNFFVNKKIDTSIPSVSLNEYEQLSDVSVDYALIEKTKKLVLIPFPTKWTDIGSWDAIYEVSQKNKNGNCLLGKTADIDSSNSLVYSTSKLTATVGLKDTIVVETEDAVLVTKRNSENGIKNIYKKLNGKNSKTKEIHKTVYRPWGYYTVLENGNGFLTKCITVNPNAKLSVQKHHYRSEHWIVLEGVATVQKGAENIVLNAGESVDIAVEEIHSLQNNGDIQLKILEVQQGDILDENDIVRLEDIYGRV